MKPKVIEKNIETGEETEREMTDAEYAIYLKTQEELKKELTDWAAIDSERLKEINKNELAAK